MGHSGGHQPCHWRQLAALTAPLLIAACQTVPVLEPDTGAENRAAVETYRSPCLQISMQDRTGHIVLGYGSGQDLRSALGRAYGDLAEKLDVAVDSTTISTRRRDRAGNIEQQLRERVETRATTDLSDVERICLDQDDPGGDTHVAVRVDLRSPARIAAEALAHRWNGIPESIDWHAPPSLRHSPFIRALRRTFADQPRVAGTIEARLDLYRRAGQWQLAINGTPLPTGNATLGDFIDWSSAARGNIDLLLVDENGSQLRSQMPDGDEFRIRVEIEKGGNGLLTLLAGHPDGSLSALRENVPLAENPIVPPPPGVFSAEIDREGRATRIHFLALVAASPINIAPWLAPRGESANPQGLLEWLEKQSFSVATAEILVIP